MKAPTDILRDEHGPILRGLEGLEAAATLSAETGEEAERQTDQAAMSRLYRRAHEMLMREGEGQARAIAALPRQLWAVRHQHHRD